MNKIVQASTEKDIETARELFREYESWLGLDLCFQGFEAELASLPGKYAPPEGRLMLALAGEEAVGCIAMRGLGDGVCEMKRLYLRDAARGKGIGRALIEAVLAAGRESGYAKMRLDTYPPKMGTAVKLYREYGFYDIEPYYDNPHSDVLYLEVDLVAYTPRSVDQVSV